MFSYFGKIVRYLNFHSQLVAKMVKVNSDPYSGEGTIWFDYFNVTGDFNVTEGSNITGAPMLRGTPMLQGPPMLRETPMLQETPMLRGRPPRRKRITLAQLSRGLWVVF